MVNAQRRSRDICDDRVDELGEATQSIMARIRKAGEKTCRHFPSRGRRCSEPLLVLRDDLRRKRTAPVSMKANKEVLVKVERVPLAREEVLDEGLVELKSIIVRLDRAVILGDNAHRQVLVEVRARLSKSLEKRVGVVEVGKEGLGNEDVTAGEEESETVAIGARRVEQSNRASRPDDCSSYCGESSAEVRPGTMTREPVTDGDSRKRPSSQVYRRATPLAEEVRVPPRRVGRRSRGVVRLVERVLVSK